MDLDQLLDRSSEQLTQLTQLYSARQLQRLNSSLGRKQLALLKRLRKANKKAPPMEKPDVVRTHRWKKIILPDLVGVYNEWELSLIHI